MKKFIPMATFVLGGVVTYRWLLPSKRRETVDRVRARMRERVADGMEHLMDAMPDDSPPKLVVTTLPKLRQQSDEMLQLLKEQNERIRALERERELV